MTAPQKSRAYFPERTYVLCTCRGCGLGPVRDEPENNVRGPTNWMLTCPSCERRLCAVCFDADMGVCMRCLAAALNRIELGGLLSA